MDRNLDSDYYIDDEMVEDDENKKGITITFENMSEEDFLAEQNMSFEELREKERPYYEEAKRLGLSHYVVRLNEDEDEDEDDEDGDYDDEDDPFSGELDVFEDEY